MTNPAQHPVPAAFEQAGPRHNPLTQHLNVFRRRWRTIVASTVAALAIATVLLFVLTPYYTARVQILLDPRKQNVMQSQQVLQNVALDAGVVESEVTLLQSFEIARRVVEKLRLDKDTEFADTGGGLGLGTLWRVLRDAIWKPAPELPGDAAQLSPEALAAIATLRDRLSARRVSVTYVIDLGVTSKDPAKSARLANAVADAYLVEQLEARYAATRRASGWLSERLDGLRGQVETSERAVTDYRASNNLLEVAAGNLDKQQVAEVSAQLAIARARTVETKAKFDQIERMASRGGNVAAVAEVLQSQVVTSLRAQEAEVARREADLAARYGPLHPSIVNVKAEITDIRRAIRSEVDRILANVRNEYEVAQKREQSLQDSVGSLTGAATQSDGTRVKLRELERDAEANRTLYQSFLARFKETREQTTLDTSDSRVITPALLPTYAASPRKSVLYGIALVLGLLSGVGAAFLLEFIENGFVTPEQIEMVLDLPVLTALPSLTATEFDPKRKGESILNYVANKPLSRFSEGVRSARVAVALSNVDTPPRLILVTSSVPSEGKSTVATAMALSAASSGQRTLVIDGDLRHPSTSKLFNIEMQRGLVELLAGSVQPHEVLVPVSGLPLVILPAGAQTKNPPDLLGSQRMRQLLAAFRQTYDLVIIDTPPVTAVIDSLTVAPHVDKIIFVVEWENTPRDVVQRAMSVIAEHKRKIAGVVLNKVDLDRIRYRETYYSYYNKRYGRYGKYYSE